jgi:hypothetical protein
MGESGAVIREMIAWIGGDDRARKPRTRNPLDVHPLDVRTADILQNAKYPPVSLCSLAIFGYD